MNFFIKSTIVLALFGLGYQMGYLSGSYVKTRDLELVYQDGIAQAKQALEVSKNVKKK